MLAHLPGQRGPVGSGCRFPSHWCEMKITNIPGSIATSRSTPDGATHQKHHPTHLWTHLNGSIQISQPKQPRQQLSMRPRFRFATHGEGLVLLKLDDNPAFLASGENLTPAALHVHGSKSLFTLFERVLQILSTRNAARRRDEIWFYHSNGTL